MTGSKPWQLPDHLVELEELGGCDILKEVLGIFLVDTPSRLARIVSAMEREDAPQLAKEAHALKGGCLQIGADTLAAHAAELEAGAPAGRWPALLEQLSTEYASIASQVRARCAGPAQ
jgi:HPt (histidine-containing phosphotransfer) domain-containing protein